MQKESLLIINDVTGYGRVSTFAMLPVLAKQGIHAYILPTALVSNTMDYGSAEILDTTSFMRNTINKWASFNFKFKNIVTGLINSSEQVDIIMDLIRSQDSPRIIVDPIMADGGKLYPEIYAGAVECNRKLIAIADVIVPNITEATMLIDEFVGRTTFSMNEYEYIAKKLSTMGPKEIVITGCRLNDNSCFNLVYTSVDNSIKQVKYENVPVSLIGTGDVFSAVLTASIIKGSSLLEAVENASILLRKIAINNIDNKDPFDLIIEPYI